MFDIGGIANGNNNQYVLSIKRGLQCYFWSVLWNKVGSQMALTMCSKSAFYKIQKFQTK